MGRWGIMILGWGRWLDLLVNEHFLALGLQALSFIIDSVIIIFGFSIFRLYSFRACQLINTISD